MVFQREVCSVKIDLRARASLNKTTLGRAVTSQPTYDHTTVAADTSYMTTNRGSTLTLARRYAHEPRCNSWIRPAQDPRDQQTSHKESTPASSEEAHDPRECHGDEDRQPARSTCAARAQHMRSTCTAHAQHMHSTCAARPQHMRSTCTASMNGRVGAVRVGALTALRVGGLR